MSKCRAVLCTAFAGGRGGVGSSEGGLFACMSVQAVASCSRFDCVSLVTG